MPRSPAGIVIFGDVVDSRDEPTASVGFLRTLCRELEGLYDADKLASFGFTQGDELQGLLAPSADPFRAILHAGLHPDYRPIRWAIAAGRIEDGSGPATERTGEAFLAARQALEWARARRDRLVVRTGDPHADGLLDDLATLLVEHLDGLTGVQREATRLLAEDGLRQAQVADRLGVTRATVSVVAKRARARSIIRLARAIDTIFAAGVGEAVGAGRGGGRP
ncbi:MAG TPA: SatD family protein [Candidatus Limnocylindrales bacterium]|nr:SatD family protein [Candidatus Limnocylindrales bacterium]